MSEQEVKAMLFSKDEAQLLNILLNIAHHPMIAGKVAEEMRELGHDPARTMECLLRKYSNLVHDGDNWCTDEHCKEK